MPCRRISRTPSINPVDSRAAPPGVTTESISRLCHLTLVGHDPPGVFEKQDISMAAVMECWASFRIVGTSPFTPGERELLGLPLGSWV